MTSPIPGMELQFSSMAPEIRPRRTGSVTAIPSSPKCSQAGCCFISQPHAIAIHERVELYPMRIFLLRIDVQGEGLRCPLRANKRIFAAHEVAVAGPEQAVIVRVFEKRQNAYLQ